MKELTKNELAVLRSRAVVDYYDQGVRINEFTCDKCSAATSCPYVFDGYNTDGDCLAEK